MKEINIKVELTEEELEVLKRFEKEKANYYMKHLKWD